MVILLLLAHWAGSGHLSKLHWNVGPHHFLQSTSGYSPQSDCSGDAFFMTRRHSDTASFEVIGPVTLSGSSADVAINDLANWTACAGGRIARCVLIRTQLRTL